MSNEVIEVGSNEEGDNRKPKRLRISRACANCRNAKLKCDGDTPACSPCRQQSKRCSYEATSKRRGLRSGYVRALELLWGLTFNEVDNAEAVAELLLGRLSKQDLATSADRSDVSSPASVVLDRWKQSTVSRRLDELLDECEEPNVGLGTGQGTGEIQQMQLAASAQWTMVSKVEHASNLQAYSNFSAYRSSTEQTSITAQQSSCPSSSRKIAETPSYARQLISLCFEHVQSWLPILDRHIILKTVFQCNSNSVSGISGDQAALWGLYAYTSATLNHMLENQSERNHARQNSRIFYTQAYSMLPLDSNDPIELGHIQCIVLIALTRFVSGAFIATSRLLKLAIDWIPQLSVRDKAQDALCRLYLAIFILDTVAAAKRQEIPTISFGSIEHHCEFREGVEEWQSWQGTSALEAQTTSLMPSDVPTRALSLLVLNARLLRPLNDRLRSKTADRFMTMVELTRWVEYIQQQDFDSSFMSALSGDAIGHTTLPPGFVCLRIIYTALCDPGYSHTGGIAAEHTDPILGHINPRLTMEDLTKLSNAPHAFDCFPLIVLLLPGMLPSAEGDPTVPYTNGAHTTGQRDFAITSTQESHHPLQRQARENAEEAHNIPEGISDMQEHSDRLLASLNRGTALNTELPDGHDPDSVPSFDSYSFPIDAPFLDFMDDLDERAA